MEIKSLMRDRLVVSADDFGKSRTANENILFLARERKIDRVAVLVSRDFLNTDIATLLDSQVKIDLHLDIDRFSRKAETNKSSLVRAVVFLWHYLLYGFSASKVTSEWTAQLEKFKEIFGRYPDGLNSHQYIHFFPPYFKIALGLSKKYEISYLRFGKQGISENVNSISGILSRLWKINNPEFRKFLFDSSDFLASFDWIKDFPKFLSALPTGRTELIFHPERKQEFKIVNKYF